MGLHWEIDLYSDATAAIGIARRKGMGRIRQLDATDLRVQEKFNNKLAFLHKVLGAENPADLLTKYTDKAVLTMALGKMGMRHMDGRSAVAPAAMGTSANANAYVLTSELSDLWYWLGARLPDTAPGNRRPSTTISVADRSGALPPHGLLHVIYRVLVAPASTGNDVEYFCILVFLFLGPQVLRMLRYLGILLQLVL